MNTANISTMEELKKKAVQIKDSMWVYYPQVQRRMQLNASGNYHHMNRKHFACKNGILSFIDESAKVYVIPDSEGKIETFLQKNGYFKMHFYVPFAEGDYPVDESQKEKWQALLSEKVA